MVGARKKGKELLSYWSTQVREQIASYVVASLIGALITILVFYITATPTDSEKIKLALLSDVRDSLNSQLQFKSGTAPTIERFISQRLDLNASDSIVLYGSWEPQNGKIYKWVSLFEPREQDLLSKLVGRPGFYVVKALWHVDAKYHEALRPVGIEAKDLDGDGSLEIFVNLESEWADSRSVGFVILKRGGGGKWNLIGLPSIAETTKEILDGALPHPEKLVPASPNGPIDYFSMKENRRRPSPPPLSRLKHADVYSDVWSFKGPGGEHKITTLRNGGAFSILEHARKRHVQIATVAFYVDGRSTLDTHYSVVTFFVFRKGQLMRDVDWNWGYPMFSTEPIRARDIDIHGISKAGLEAHRIGTNYFWYRTFESQ